MANFLEALNLTLKNEGGYVNDSADKGGETYQGISRRYHASWLGWGYLDNITPKKYNQTFPALNSFVADFYYQEFWINNLLDRIESNQLANVVFDWLVNSSGAAKQIQTVLNDFGQGLAVDGQIGPQTIAALNAVNPIALVNAITEQRINYYQTGVKKGWFDSKFLAGLINRANAYGMQAVENVGKHRAKA